MQRIMREWLSGRALPCQGKCREFESRLPLQYGSLAQLVEHLPYKQMVIGSSPIIPTIKLIALKKVIFLFYNLLLNNLVP